MLRLLLAFSALSIAHAGSLKRPDNAKNAFAKFKPQATAFDWNNLWLSAQVMRLAYFTDSKHAPTPATPSTMPPTRT